MADDTNEVHEPDRVLGEDPLNDLDIEWMDDDAEAEIGLESLGGDPFVDVDMSWMEDQNTILKLSPTEQSPALDEFEADLDLVVTPESVLDGSNDVYLRRDPALVPVTSLNHGDSADNLGLSDAQPQLREPEREADPLAAEIRRDVRTEGVNRVAARRVGHGKKLRGSVLRRLPRTREDDPGDLRSSSNW